MFWAAFAVGAAVGACLGIVIMCLAVVSRRADDAADRYVEKHCKQCEVYWDETADTSVCFSCVKNRG